ncbi:MAG: sulfatase-like hydrolase/transferase, partial [Gemmatimonadota bacterium]|nr:sulfatase-like hydrolase/transferase [Gemmatimonadota bacterium]
EGQFAETPYVGDHSYLPHRTPRAAYAAMITRMDWHIGRLMALLDSLGLDEQTLVMFSSDNGPTYVGGVDTEFFRSTGGLRGLKGSVFEGGIRVPFIARWPGRIAPKSESAHVSAFWDVVPTVGALLGLELPDDLDGRSFLPTLLGQPGQVEHASLYWEYHGLWKGAQAVRMGRWKGVRLGAHEDANAPIALFDLVQDPFEEQDVAAAHPDVVRRIAAVMASRTVSGIAAWNFPAPPRP